MSDKPETLGPAPAQQQPLPQAPEKPMVVTLPLAADVPFRDEMRTLEVEPASRRVDRAGDPFVVYSFAPDIPRSAKATLQELSEKYGINHTRTVTEAAERRVALRDTPSAKLAVPYDQIYRDTFTVSYPAEGASESADLRRLKFEGAIVDFFADRMRERLIDLPVLKQEGYLSMENTGARTEYHFHIPIKVPAGVTPASVIEKEYGRDYARIREIARKYSGNITIGDAPANFIQ